MYRPDQQLLETFRKLGIQFEGQLVPLPRQANRRPWGDLPTESLLRIRSILKPEPPRSLVSELSRRGIWRA